MTSPLNAESLEKGYWQTYRIFLVHNLQIRYVPQIINLGPVDRDTSASLHKAELYITSLLTILSVEQDDLLSFVEIGDVALRVNAAREVPCASTIS